MPNTSETVLIISSQENQPLVPLGRNDSEKDPEKKVIALTPLSLQKYNAIIDYNHVRKRVDDIADSLLAFLEKEYADLLHVEDISLSTMVRLAMQNAFLEVVFFHEYLDKVLQTEKPVSIILYDDASSFVDIMKTWLSSKDLSVTIIPAPSSLVLFSKRRNMKTLVHFQLKKSYILTLRPLLFKLQRFYTCSARLDTKKDAISSLDMLFITCHPASYRCLLPIIEEARNQQKKVLLLVQNAKVQSLLRKTTIPFMLFSDFLPKNSPQLIARLRHNIEHAWNNLLQNDSFTTLIVGWGIPKSQVLTLLKEIFFIRMVQAAECVLASKEFIGRYNPKILVVGTDTHLQEKSCIHYAKKYNIPSLNIQHGTVGYTELMLPLSADYMAVWDKANLDKLVAKGADPKRLVITGQPRYDSLVQGKVMYDRDEVCRIFHIDLKKPLLLILTSPFPKALNTEFLLAALDAAIHLPGMQILIKAHPEEDVSLHKIILHIFAKRFALSKDAGEFPNIPIIRHFDTFSLLKASDLILSMYSSVVLEAVLLNKDVIVSDLSGDKTEDFEERGIVLVAHQKKDIASLINQLITSPDRKHTLATKRKTFLKEYAFADGKATDRVMDLMQKMVQHRTHTMDTSLL
ncbi:UDP-N-acetylglucosamine 2-epimerase [Candidatus Woesearchaeota archaeon]|nr:UDP-N-acetylglucosamine 2-epimerase [Candidatus Woesearchaeota archaeon]